MLSKSVAVAETEVKLTRLEAYKIVRRANNYKTLLVTGDRNWTNKDLVLTLLKDYRKRGYRFLLHGDCPTGLDSIAHDCAIALGFIVVPFPADWIRYGLAAGPIRNREMLDEKPDSVLGFHDNILASKGTKDCVFEALRRKVPSKLYNSQGMEYLPSLN
jgi:hypothetical protein